MSVAIYKITNTVNGKHYFGQTVNPKRRWAQHKRNANKRRHVYKLYIAMNKYGVDKFVFNVVHWCGNKDDANELEQFIIQESCARTLGYNMAVGGEGCGSGVDHPAYGVQRSQTFIANIKARQTGRMLTPEWKQAISDSLKGVPKTAEHAAKVGAAHKGKIKPISEAHKAKLRTANAGKRPSEACIAAATAAKLGRKHSPESIEKMRQAALGRKRSPEEKAKIAAGMRAFRAKQKEVQ